jgi:hypothetical protein
MTRKTDHNGEPIPSGETDETRILVWEVTPHPTNPDYDCMVVRSYQDMCDYVGDNIDIMLEQIDDRDLREGVALTFRLRDMSLGDYREIMENEP